MRTTIAELDSLDEKGIFHCAPITLKDFRGDFFGCDPLIEQTRTRVKEILESKSGDPLHNEMHFANAIILLFGLGSYHIHYRDVSEANKILKEAEALAEQHIKQPLLLGTIYLYAAQGLNLASKLISNLTTKINTTAEYQSYLKKAFTYFNAVSPTDQPALLRQLVSIKPELHLCRDMLEKFTAEQVNKANPVECADSLLQYYLEHHPSEVEVKKLDSLASDIPSKMVTGELIKLFEQKADESNSSIYFNRVAVRLLLKMENTDIALLTRLSFKAYSKALNTKDEKSWQDLLEDSIVKLTHLSLQQRSQVTTSCFQLQDWLAVANMLKGNPKIILLYPFVFGILQLFPQKIADLIELLIRHAAGYAHLPDNTQWAQYLNQALEKTLQFLTLIKKDRQSLTYFTDAALNQAICKIFETWSQWCIGHPYSNFHEVQPLLLSILKTILTQSEPFAHAFPSYLAFRVKVLSKFVSHAGDDKSKVSSMEEKIGVEISAFIENNKNLSSLPLQMRPVIEEFLMLDHGFNLNKRLLNFNKALKAYQMASAIKDNESILKSLLVLASFYNRDDFRNEGLTSGAVSQNFDPYIGQEAKKYLVKFFDKVQQATLEETRKVLTFVISRSNPSGLDFNLFSTNLSTAAIAAKCDKSLIELMIKVVPDHCERSKWQQIISACCIASLRKDSDVMNDLLSVLMSFSNRIHEHQWQDLIGYYQHSIMCANQNSDDAQTENSKLLYKQTTCFDPVVGHMFLAFCRRDRKISIEDLSRAAAALQLDCHNQSTATLLSRCINVLHSLRHCHSDSIRYNLLDEKSMSALIQADQAVITALEEIIKRSKFLIDNKIDAFGFYYVVNLLQLAYRQWLLKEESLANQTFDKMKSFVEKNLQSMHSSYQSWVVRFADELRSKQLYASASLLYQFAIELPIKKNINIEECCYKLLDCHLHLKNLEKIIPCFQSILESIKPFFAKKELGKIPQVHVQAYAFGAINKLLEEKYVDQAMSWYELFLVVHEKIYKNQEKNPAFVLQYARICAVIGSYCKDSDRASYLLEKSLSLYLKSLSMHASDDTLQAAIKIIIKLRDNQQTQQQYYVLLEQALQALQSKQTSFLPQFIDAGTFLYEKDNTNRSMQHFFSQVCALLIKFVGKEVMPLQELANRLTQAAFSCSSLQDLCLSQDNFLTTMVSQMQANKDKIESLQRENQQLCSQMESKLESKSVDSNNVGSDNTNSNSNRITHHAGQKRPLEALPAAGNKSEEGDEPTAKRQMTSHPNALFQSQSAPAPDQSPKPSNLNQSMQF